MSAAEQQEEEKEVLQSIYEGDDNFTAVSNNTYQYKVGEEGDYKAFLLEIVWGENYPDEIPQINLNAFFNRHLSESVKDEILGKVKEQAEEWMGMPVTYTLFEWVKENQDSLTINQIEPQQILIEQTNSLTINNVERKEKQKKEQLTKAQKRKLFDRTNSKGERPRGSDWVDVVKHLSQTGSKQATPPIS